MSDYHISRTILTQSRHSMFDLGGCRSLLDDDTDCVGIITILQTHGLVWLCIKFKAVIQTVINTTLRRLFIASVHQVICVVIVVLIVTEDDSCVARGIPTRTFGIWLYYVCTRTVC